MPAWPAKLHVEYPKRIEEGSLSKSNSQAKISWPDDQNTWIGIGGGFASVDEDVASRFMDRLRSVADVVKGDVDIQSWRQKAGLRALYLVLEHEADGVELNIERGSLSDGVQVFSLSYDWLSPAVLSGTSGQWRLLGLIALALAELTEEYEVALPPPGVN